MGMLTKTIAGGVGGGFCAIMTKHRVSARRIPGSNGLWFLLNCFFLFIVFRYLLLVVYYSLFSVRCSRFLICYYFSYNILTINLLNDIPFLPPVKN